MEINEIIDELKRYDGTSLSKEAIFEARKHKSEMTEKFLEEIDNVANNTAKYTTKEYGDYYYHILAMLMLAEFKEKRAFDKILNFLTKNQDEVDDLIGILIDDSLPQVLASTFDGNVEKLEKIILNPDLHTDIRKKVFETFEILERQKKITNDEIINKIENWLNNELKNDQSFIGDAFVKYIENKKIYEKLTLVKRLYDEKRIDVRLIGDYDDFIDDIFGKVRKTKKDFIEDTIEEIDNNFFMSSNEREKEDEKKEDLTFEDIVKKLIKSEREQISKELNIRKAIGRNDLCPCGSGKKYKKCCMSKEKEDEKTEADIYIERALKMYPLEEIKKFYDDETIRNRPKIICSIYA